MKMTPSVVLQRFRQNKPILLWVPTPTYHEWFIEMAEQASRAKPA